MSERRARNGELARRRADPPPGIAPESSSVSTADVAFSSAPRAWRSWLEVPAEIHSALVVEEWDPFEPIVAGATEQSPDHDERKRAWSAWAWAVEDDALTLLDVVPGERFRGGARGPWLVTVKRQTFSDVKHRLGTVSDDHAPDMARSSGDDDKKGPGDARVIDMLPDPVQRQILSTVSSAEREDEFMFQSSTKGTPTEHKGGVLRVAGEVMIAVSAIRKIKPSRRMSRDAAERSLANTPWSIEAVTARLGPQESATLLVNGERGEETRVLSKRRERALPHVPSGRHTIG